MVLQKCDHFKVPNYCINVWMQKCLPNGAVDVFGLGLWPSFSSSVRVGAGLPTTLGPEGALAALLRNSGFELTALHTYHFLSLMFKRLQMSTESMKEKTYDNYLHNYFGQYKRVVDPGFPWSWMGANLLFDQIFLKTAWKWRKVGQNFVYLNLPLQKLNHYVLISFILLAWIIQ